LGDNGHAGGRAKRNRSQKNGESQTFLNNNCTLSFSKLATNNKRKNPTVEQDGWLFRGRDSHSVFLSGLCWVYVGWYGGFGGRRVVCFGHCEGGWGFGGWRGCHSGCFGCVGWGVGFVLSSQGSSGERVQRKREKARKSRESEDTKLHVKTQGRGETPRVNSP